MSKMMKVFALLLALMLATMNVGVGLAESLSPSDVPGCSDGGMFRGCPGEEDTPPVEEEAPSTPDEGEEAPVEAPEAPEAPEEETPVESEEAPEAGEAQAPSQEGNRDENLPEEGGEIPAEGETNPEEEISSEEAPAEGEAPAADDAPAEDPLPDTAELVGTIEDQLDPSRHIDLYADWGGGELVSGTEATLYAVLTGYENAVYTLQWQYSTDNEHWFDIEGETEATCKVVVDETNYMDYWRVVVTITDVTEEAPQQP